MSALLAAFSVAAAIAAAGGRRAGGRLHALRGGADRAEQTSDIALWSLAGSAAIGAVLAASTVPLPVVVMVSGAAILATRVWSARRAARAREERSAAAVEATFALAGELRAGRTPEQALAAVAGGAGPLRPVFEAAHAAGSMGGDVAAELARAASLAGAEQLRYVAAAWSVADSAGARVAVVLERLSEAMDSEEEIRHEVAAAMAGPRATVAVLSCLPVLGLALGEAVGAHPMQLLLHSALGWALLGAAGLLDLLGVVLTRAIVRIALRS